MHHKCGDCFFGNSFAYFSKETASGTAISRDRYRIGSCDMNTRSSKSFIKSWLFLLAFVAAPLHAVQGIEPGDGQGRSRSASDASNALLLDREESTRKNGGQLERLRYSTLAEGEQEVAKVCMNRSIEEFPEDLFTYEQRRHGAVVLHAVLGFYCFVLTALVCHNYLLPSLDRICVEMNISTDVAGATFLAVASSCPELFVNVIGTFLTESDLGVGTVVGSAVFDTFATPACGALTTLHAIPLQWHVLSRDCLVYVLSVALLVIIMWDGKVAWYEAVILLVLLLAYLVLLFTGKCIVRRCASGHAGSTDKLSNDDKESSPNGSYEPYPRNDAPCSGNSNGHDVERQQRNGTNDPEEAEKYEEPENLFAWPKERTAFGKFWFLLNWPLKFLLLITIPDTRRKRFRNWYAFTFIMCVIWIAISSYLVSWMMTAIGDTIGIPDSIMGITFLAAGGNMPEVASILILAKQGDGNMAMSNTLGANIMDILLCLGLPWTIKCLMTGKDVEIESGTLSYIILSIVVCIVVLYAVIGFCKFHLNKKVGYCCLILYTIFLVFAILIELNVFFPLNLPMCDY